MSLIKVSCSNGRLIVDKGLITKIEETWYGDQFDVDEKLTFISESGAKEALKIENARVESKVKPIKYHWPEADRVGLREGYAYDKTLRAHISKKKLVDFAEFNYSTSDGTKITREMDIFFLKKTQFSIFGMNTVITVEGGESGKKGTLQWVLNAQATAGFLKKGLKYAPHPDKIKGSELGADTIWYGDSHHRLATHMQLLASTVYQNNRTKIIEISIPQKENSPNKIEISSKSIEDTAAWKPQKRIFPIIEFSVDVPAGKKENYILEFRFIFIPERNMNDVCFIVPDSEEYWPCAYACAVNLGEKREHFAAMTSFTRRLNVFNPIMWYQEDRPLDPSIYDYLLSLRELDKICLFGVPRIEDIQQLIILLLDRGSELSELDFYIFTKSENLKEIQARKEEIAQRVLIARGKADPGILEIIKNIIKIHAIPDLKNAPLEFRKIFYRQEIISKYDRPSSEYLLVLPDDPCIAAIITPLARYLQCPVLLYSENSFDLEDYKDLIEDFKGKNPLALIIYSKKAPRIAEQLKNFGYTNYAINYDDESELAIKIAQILETLKAFSLGFEGSLRSKSLSSSPDKPTLLSVLMKIDSNTGKKYESFLDKELISEEIHPQDYLKAVLDFSFNHFKEFFKIYYENWGFLEEVVFNSAILCETMADEDETQRRCHLLMAGNYAFYKNAPLIPIRPTTEKLENLCQTSIGEIDNIISSGANPEKSLKKLGKEIHNALITPTIDNFLKILIPNNLPYFTVRSRIPLELIHDGDAFWSLRHGFGRISGLDQNSTALLTNLSVSISPIPKESLKILLIANPTLDLPDASKELVQLRQRLKGFEIETIEGWDAREHDVIMNINQGPNIIHYSGHGYLDPILPLRSGLILTDSRLTALEISHLKLWSNPLIFTNACLSAALGTAFLHAGSCFFVSPLWSVTDFAALEYAYAFYSSIISGWALGEAQKTAKNLVHDLLGGSEDYSHDFTWLAYSCIGDPSYSLIYVKPWEKQAFGEIIYAWHFVKQKSIQCARNKIIKSVFNRILMEVKQLAKESAGDTAFDPILPLLEPLVTSITSATEVNWIPTMKSIVTKLDELDNLAKKIDNLSIQDRVRQLFGMIFIASKI
ncbi:MAG: CHAT domain-containing protein [Candidatus Helarchaeota archaeon]|nr:CHAT domain-containing protein [Candidatus Helarchaeota archaeon]